MHAPIQSQATRCHLRLIEPPPSPTLEPKKPKPSLLENLTDIVIVTTVGIGIAVFLLIGAMVSLLCRAWMLTQPELKNQ